MKNGYENNSSCEKVVILLQLHVTCSVTPIEGSYYLVFNYRLFGESEAVTRHAVPDKTFKLTKELSEKFSDEVLHHLGDCCNEDDIFFDGNILSKCIAYDKDQIAEILSLVHDAAIELSFKFNALAVPGFAVTEDTKIEIVNLEMNLDQYTVE